MKLLKRILLAVLLIVIIGGTISFFYFRNKFLSAPPNELTVTNLGQPFGFTWDGMTVDDKHYPYKAMLVPVSIPGVEKSFYMQFDTGAPNTVLYYKPFQSINEEHNNLIKIDTIDNKLRAVNTTLKVGSVDVMASSLRFVNLGKKINWSDSTVINIIGTVGNDFIEKNPIIMDFKKNTITLLDSLPKQSKSDNNYLPFTFDGRKIFLSAKLNNEPASLWYDSGSSMFELIVEESTFWELADPKAEKETLYINSWGTKVPAHNSRAKGNFDFGSVRIPLRTVTYMEWPNKMQALLMKAANIGGDLGGMTGNKLFIGKTLILDAPNLRYSVRE